MTNFGVDLDHVRASGEIGPFPIRLGVLGDFAGDGEQPRLGERRFLPVSEPDLGSLLEAIRPELRLSVADDRGEVSTVRLAFSSLEDFTQAGVRRRFGAAREPAPPEPSTGGSLLDRILAGEEGSDGVARRAEQVLQDERFRRLSAAWFGLARLAACCGGEVELVVASAERTELLRDLELAPELEDAFLFRRLYSDVYRAKDGVPITALVHAHEFSTHPDDEGLLRYLATVASEAQTPVLASAAPSLVNLDWQDFRPLAETGGSASLLGGPQHTGWRSLRDEEDLRLVTIVLPRWRASGSDAWDPWIGGVWLLGAQLAHAYRRERWPAGLCDEELAAAEVEVECTVAPAAARRLAKDGLALLATTPAGATLVRDAVSVHRPVAYHDEELTRMAREMAGLPYVASSCRLHQALLCRARGPAGSAEELTAWLAQKSAPPDVARTDPMRPLVLEGAVERTPDGSIAVRVRPAFRLPAMSGTAKVSLPLPE